MSLSKHGGLLSSALLAVLAAMPAFPAFAQTQTPHYAGSRGTLDFRFEAEFDNRCATCHTVEGVDNAPARGTVFAFPPERVLAAITTGPMAEYASGLSDEDRRRLAEIVSGRPLGNSAARSASAMPNRCTGAMRMGDPTRGPRWNGPTGDPHNTRFIPADMAQLPANRLSELTLKWAFGMPDGTSMRGQPTVVGGWLFIGSDNGMVYALDARSGCVYWSFQANGPVVVTVSVAPFNGDAARYAAYFGDHRGNAYAVDAETGALLWTRAVDEHPQAKIVGSPVVDVRSGRIFVPVGTWEQAIASSLNYECCTFRGSVVALDATTGRQIWQTYTMEEPLRPIRKNSAGTQLYGPAGAAVWVAPTIDHERGAIYVGTSDAYLNVPDVDGVTDAIHAFDLETGRRLWHRQLLVGDYARGGCGRTVEELRLNCPEEREATRPATFDGVSTSGDDVSASVILHTLPNGREILVASQESRRVTLLDPDRNGAIIWQRIPAVRGTANTGNLGLALDASADLLYLPMQFSVSGPNAEIPLQEEGGVTAIRPGTGEIVWSTTIPMLDDCERRTDPPFASDAGSCRAGHRAAVTAIPGVVFAGADDGFISAFSAEDGTVLWRYDTAREFETVNGVTAIGGVVGGYGATVVGGMVYVGSGYFLGGMDGNVLLAFGPP